MRVLTALALAAASSTILAGASEKAAIGEDSATLAIVALTVLAVAAYVRGARRLRQRAPGRGLRAARITAFGAGIASLMAALFSPLDVLAERSFAAHMVQHEALMLVSALLLVLGQPLAAWAWAFPRFARGVSRAFSTLPLSALWRFITHPAGATSLQVGALWLWHFPRFFDAALDAPLLHFAQHASFLLSAICFWWSVSRSARHRSGAGIIALFVAMVASGALGALLALSPAIWYAPYATSAIAGLTPLEDQQLGGLLMWIPGGVAYLVAALASMRRILVSRAPFAARAGAP